MLAAVYSILVAAGVLFPAPPVVPEGPMFVPELSQEQEERFAEQKKRYGTLFLTVSSAKPFTVTKVAIMAMRSLPSVVGTFLFFRYGQLWNRNCSSSSSVPPCRPVLATAI